MNAITEILRNPTAPSGAAVLSAITDAVQDIADAHSTASPIDFCRDVPENVRRLTLVMARDALAANWCSDDKMTGELLALIIKGRNLSGRGYGYDNDDAERLREHANEAREVLEHVLACWCYVADQVDGGAL